MKTPFLSSLAVAIIFVFSSNTFARPIPGSKQSEWGPEDRPYNLGFTLKYKTLEQLESANLKKGALKEQPWSDDYWPIYEGGPARRYADPSFPMSRDWKENIDYLTNPQNTCSIDQLSPAEKYDLWVGDSEKTLTKSALYEGKYYYDEFQEVEGWMGYCHGWTAASLNVPRPTHYVDVLAADKKTKIRFFPADIKALATLIWAKAPGTTRFVGSRCEQKEPTRDAVGRITDPDCADTNPGTIHLSLTHLIGGLSQGFVVNVGTHAQVWNQPAFAYEYTYFNPKTNQPAQTIRDAKVALSEFSQDPYKKYRSTRAVSIVGVVMTASYSLESSPTQDLTDHGERDRYTSIDWRYDLELDANNQIIGGEWRNYDYPSFLWRALPTSKASTPMDEQIDVVDPRSTVSDKGLIPASWQKAAKKASQGGAPLAHIVDALVLKARMQP